MKSLLLFILLCFSITGNTQILKGKVYDAEATVKGIEVLNLTKKITTKTDDIGEFNIRAEVNDSIKFQSLFHHPKIIVVKENQLKELIVFELKKAVNELDEVLISEDLKEKPFEEEVYSSNLKKAIAEDIKNNPHLYSAAPKYGLDIFQLIGLAAKLFKKKSKVPEFVPLTYTDIQALFSGGSLFNEKLLKETLKIPLKHKFLFFEFCEAKQIDSKLLNKNENVELLEEFVLLSQKFLVIVEIAEAKD